MSVREMMARLNAKTIRYDVGRGGKPELTDQDIAAAVGMCANETARELFCWIWWPSAVGARTAATRKLVLQEVWKEYNDRYVAVETARLAVHNFECILAGAHRISEDDRQELERRRATVRHVHASVWPARMEMYARIVDTVVEEIRSPRPCPDCSGRGHRPVDGVVRTCSRCNGQGHVREFNTWRAARLGVSESRYRATWSVVYDWVFKTLDELEQEARSTIEEALGRDAA